MLAQVGRFMDSLQMSRKGDTVSMAAPSATVIVAVDFSEDSEAAVHWAVEYAEATNKSLKILHIAHEPPGAPGFYRSDPADLLLPLQEVAEKYLKEFFAKLCLENPSHSVLRMAEPLLVEGVPAERIVEVAVKIGADDIVLGSRGLTGLPHLLLGSTAQYVAQHASIPVTIVKATETALDDE